MPKLKPQIEQEKRERAVMRAFNRGKFERDIDSTKELAAMLHIPYSTMLGYKSAHFQNMRMDDFCRMARTLGFSGADMCEIVGVKP